MTTKGKKTGQNVTEVVSFDDEGEENGPKRDRDRMVVLESAECYSNAAVLAARRALLSTNWMLEARESPPVRSLMRARRKGVTSLP